jgi:hypothetical protein
MNRFRTGRGRDAAPFASLLRIGCGDGVGTTGEVRRHPCARPSGILPPPKTKMGKETVKFWMLYQPLTTVAACPGKENGKVPMAAFGGRASGVTVCHAALRIRFGNGCGESDATLAHRTGEGLEVRAAGEMPLSSHLQISAFPTAPIIQSLIFRQVRKLVGRASPRAEPD